MLTGLTFYTIIMVNILSGDFLDYPPLVNQHNDNFSTKEACEKKLFEFYSSSGGELIRRNTGEVIHYLGGYFRYCVKIDVSKDNLK